MNYFKYMLIQRRMMVVPERITGTPGERLCDFSEKWLYARIISPSAWDYSPEFIEFQRRNVTMLDREDIRRRIIELEVEHRDLDAVIDVLASDARREELQLRRLKKRKLQLKDHITLLRMQLIPDIPA